MNRNKMTGSIMILDLEKLIKEGGLKNEQMYLKEPDKRHTKVINSNSPSIFTSFLKVLESGLKRV